MKGIEWVLFQVVGYLTGKGVSFGGAILPPQAVSEGVYSIGIGPTGPAQDRNLDLFKDGQLDHIYIGPLVEALQIGDVTSLFQQASQKLKIGGHLILHTRIGNHNAGATEFWPAHTEAMIGECGKWQKKLTSEQSEQSIQVYKRVPGKKGILPIKPLPAAKRVCVVRYGAFGDAIIISPLLRKLKEDGYHVTLNINPYCREVFNFNPHIDNLVVQEKDSIPNGALDGYWRFWATQYDRYINLSESLEGDLLIVEGRREFFTTKSWRHEKCNKNYYDYVFTRAGYGPETFGQIGEMHFSTAEERKAKEFFRDLEDKFVILWALNGSSHHKVYPLMEGVLTEWFKDHLDSRAITTGDYMARLLEFEHPQLIEKAGKWKIRESLLATKYANLVIGPETAITNASGCYDTPKIVLLSHSTKENLTKYFKNDYSLEPDVERAPCYPCHMLHYTRESCVEGTIVDNTTNATLAKAPICALAISPERLLAQIEVVYQNWKSR
jgi:ADP-heptose:LPS heptosyltransferase